MTEMEKINQMTDDSMMDYVDEPDNAHKKEGRIKRLVKKAKPVAANAAKNIGKMALAGVVAAGGVTLVAKLTGREICLIPDGRRDQINEICREAFTHVKDNTADVVEAAKDAVEETIDA